MSVPSKNKVYGYHQYLTLVKKGEPVELSESFVDPHDIGVLVPRIGNAKDLNFVLVLLNIECPVDKCNARIWHHYYDSPVLPKNAIHYFGSTDIEVYCTVCSWKDYMPTC